MKQLVTTAIILTRTDYGEADRILTVLTPEYGKLRVMARGVRRVKSKLAGGIELFSVSTITFVQGRGAIGTLLSTRLLKYYSQIVADIDRTMLGYELIKMLNKTTEDDAEAEYFELLEQAFEGLNDPSIDTALIQLWFWAQLLRMGGHMPNLQQDVEGQPLRVDERYLFDFEHTAFIDSPQKGTFTADHIKFLRLLFVANRPVILGQVRGSEGYVESTEPIIRALMHAAML